MGEEVGVDVLFRAGGRVLEGRFVGLLWLFGSTGSPKWLDHGPSLRGGRDAKPKRWRCRYIWQDTSRRFLRRKGEKALLGRLEGLCGAWVPPGGAGFAWVVQRARLLAQTPLGPRDDHQRWPLPIPDAPGATSRDGRPNPSGGKAP